MKLVIIHFHLNRGGVTSVILNHLKALETAGQGLIEEVLLIHGGRAGGLPETLPGLPTRVLEVPALEYDAVRRTPADGLDAQIAQRLSEAGCRPEDTVLHAHNHSLGKNVEFLNSIATLAELGWHWLLQIHDFAEDFRPGNYRHLLENAGDGSVESLTRRLYPQASQIQYAVLNGRDHAILSRAGVDEARLHTLPNPVFPLEDLPQQQTARAKLCRLRDIDSSREFLLYPVRGIRRKNMGEMLLWSVLGQNEWICATTLRPQNPLERSSYDHWKSLSQALELPCEWELGTEPELSFKEIVSASDAMLTTSLAEGFGMVFLEAWLAEKLLFGRDLPEITQDFKQAGVWFPHLSRSLLIPLDSLDLKAIRASFLISYRDTLRQFKRSPPGDRELNTEFDSLLAHDAVDFAVLDRELQSAFIAQVKSDSQLVDRVLALNPVCRSLVTEELNSQAGLIRANSETILAEFSLDSISKRLLGIYSSILQSGTESLSSLPRPQAVRDEFLQVARFHPSRVNP